VIYVIDKVKTGVKWIEFWFQDHHQVYYSFHKCAKQGYFNQAIDEADLYDYVMNNGVHGLSIEFDEQENIKRIFLAELGCKKPPSGWSCSRIEGHEGPCAASEIYPRY